MTHIAYLSCLLVGIGALTVTDYRFRLAFFYDWQRTAKTLLSAVGFFLMWDILGVALRIFSPGGSRYSLNVMVLPKIPIEELFFLFLFTYVTLLVWRLYAHLHHA